MVNRTLPNLEIRLDKWSEKAFAKQSEQNGDGGGELGYRIAPQPLSRKCGAIGPIDAQSVFVSAPYWQPPNFPQTEPELSSSLLSREPSDVA